ncbi:MAG: prephenate dehydrogenase/arogenate dehydrogenase family protein [Verrucomicrobiota bacterium]
MTEGFHNIAILGAGLLGGSLALALEKTGRKSLARLWARKEETTRAATRSGITHATSDLSTAVAGADLLVLAVPVGAMPLLLEAAYFAGLPESCLVTDVGSVKSFPHRILEPICARYGGTFIGSHPMAGSEQGGIASADPAIFENAACLLTNETAAPDHLVLLLENFWQSVGCRTIRMTAAEHDACVARVSHLPHVIAASAANVCMSDEFLIQFGGGGLRDTTRVAAGNPEMWSEILTENRESIIPLLRETIADFSSFLRLLEQNDTTAIRAWLQRAKSLRDTLPSKQP